MCRNTVPTARLHAQPFLSRTLRSRGAQRRCRRASGRRAGQSTPGCEFLRQAALRFARARLLAPLAHLPPPFPPPPPQSLRRPVRVPDIPRRPGSHAPSLSLVHSLVSACRRSGLLAFAVVATAVRLWPDAERGGEKDWGVLRVVVAVIEASLCHCRGLLQGMMIALCAEARRWQGPSVVKMRHWAEEA